MTAVLHCQKCRRRDRQYHEINDVKRNTSWFSSIRHLGFLVTFQWYWKVSKIHKGNQYYWLFRKDWKIFVAFFGSALWFPCYFLEIILSYMSQTIQISDFPLGKCIPYHWKRASVLHHKFSTPTTARKVWKFSPKYETR